MILISKIMEEIQMKEKVLNNRKNGMTVLLLVIAAYVLAVAGIVVGGMNGIPALIIG